MLTVTVRVSVTPASMMSPGGTLSPMISSLIRSTAVSDGEQLLVSVSVTCSKVSALMKVAASVCVPETLH
jgi:hypothetical protein